MIKKFTALILSVCMLTSAPSFGMDGAGNPENGTSGWSPAVIMSFGVSLGALVSVTTMIACNKINRYKEESRMRSLETNEITVAGRDLADGSICPNGRVRDDHIAIDYIHLLKEVEIPKLYKDDVHTFPSICLSNLDLLFMSTIENLQFNVKENEREKAFVILDYLNSMGGRLRHLVKSQAKVTPNYLLNMLNDIEIHLIEARQVLDHKYA